jgi:alpha-1,2-mannosyltransferase
VLGLVSFLVYLATASTGAQSMDVTSTEISAWHIADTGLPWIDDLALPARLEDSPIRSIWVQETDDGHRVVVRSPGAVAAAVPAYWLLGTSVPGPGPAAATAALLSALTLVLMCLALRTQVSDRLAVAGTLVLGFTTPFWAVSADGMWPHTVCNLGIAGMAWAAATKRWWAAGLFGALTVWGRLHAGIVVAVLGLVVGLRRRRPGITLRIAALGVVGVVAMSGWTRWMYGSWNPRSSYGVTDLTNDRTMFNLFNELGVWISPGRGLLVWTPLVLLLLPTLVRSWRTLPDWTTALVQGGLVYTVVQGSMQIFTGGDSFYAYRYGLELLTAATPALVICYQRADPIGRRLALPVVALQLVAIAPGAIFHVPTIQESRAWFDNDFVALLVRGGPPAVVIAAVVVMGVWWLLHLASRTPGGLAREG